MAIYATRNHEDALDIVQDAMLRLSSKYAERESEQWAPLFFRILQRRILDWHRRRKVRRIFVSWLPGSSDSDDDNLIDAAPDPNAVEPDRGAENYNIATSLNEAIAALPLRQQQVFLLRELQGLDVKETALAMKCSSGTVKTHYSRARASLQQALEDYADER